MSVTIKDIAKVANVSHTTVSRALNDSPLINDETKERIKAIAAQLNYSPNYSAKSLVLDRSYRIGLFFSTLHSGTSAGFLYDAVRGVNSAIKDRYDLIIKGIDDYKDYNSVTRKSFDGIIVMSQSTVDDRFIRHVANQNIPQVVLNRLYGEGKVTTVLSDDRTGAYNMTEYLLKQGHKHIAIIEGKENFLSAQKRKEGFLDALNRYKVEIPAEYFAKGNYDLESGYMAMRRLLDLKPVPTAVFCSNDEMAVGAMKAAAEKGPKVPDDISLAGFDDSGFSGFLSPALTTVKRPIERISNTGARKLLECIETKKNLQEILYMKTELVIRDSVKQMRRSENGEI